MQFNLRSIIFLLTTYIAFFASGASSLMAQVTWNRMLIVVVGNSMSATAMIVSVFMGGLGIGSYFGGKFFGKRRRSLIPYLVLEVLIGVYVMSSPAIFNLLSGLFNSLAQNTADQTSLSFIRILVSMAALLLPAILMGATFPAMISGVAPASATKGTARTGYLYSINTLGAAIGCFVAGYHLLLEFGIQFTLNIAFGLYLTAATCALIANTLIKREPAEAAASPAPALAPPDEKAELRRFLYLATFGIGFVSLAYEVLLTRLGILYLGNSVSVFPLVLTGFLLGTGLSAIWGTWLYGVLSRSGKSSNRLFGFTALFAGALVLLMPYLLLTDWVIGADHFARVLEGDSRSPLPILAIIIAPSTLLGALLPLAIRMLQPEQAGAATKDAATIYSLNTAGGVIGAGVANHYLVPTIGIQGAIILLVSICFGVGVVNLLPPMAKVRRWSVSAISVVVFAVVLVAGPPKMMDLYASKIAQSTGARTAKVMFVREGRAATVTVIDQDDPKKSSFRDMYLNGVEEASTRFWHAQLFKLLGIFPVLMHESDKPKEVAVIAFGAGIAAGSVLASDQVTSLDVVDLNPDIENINDLFTRENGDVFHKPRFNFHNDDGRNYLVTAKKHYDVIISDSTHPRAYDSWILYTEEFYQSVKNRLKPDGVFAQWVPVLASMQGALFQIHLRTFRKVFPHATFWYVYGSDQAFLLATPKRFVLDAERLQKQLDRLPKWFLTEEYQIDSVARIAGFFWMDEAMMAKMIADEKRINHDDHHYFDKQSAVWPAPPHLRLPYFQAPASPHLKKADNFLAATIRSEQRVAHLLSRYAFYKTMPDLATAFCLMPNNGNVRYFMSQEFAGKIPDPRVFCRRAQ